MKDKTTVNKTKKRLKIIKRLLFLSIVSLTIILSIPLYVNYTVRHTLFSHINNVEGKEFAIVLGAGIKKNGTPGSYLKQRLDDTYKLFNSKKIKKIVLTGDNGAIDHDEISVMNNYLVKKGVPQSILFADYAGFDTYTSMERATKTFAIDEAIIVSQGYHLPRAVYIAQYKGINAVGFSSNPNYGKKRYYAREWGATIKSFFDCIINRKARFYGKKINTSGRSNEVQDQL